MLILRVLITLAPNRCKISLHSTKCMLHKPCKLVVAQSLLVYPIRWQFRQRQSERPKMKESNITAAKAILAQQGATKQWGQREHVALLANIIMGVITAELGHLDDADPKRIKAAIRLALADDGVAGNASQFRQGLAKLDLVPKAASPDLAQYD